MKCTYSGNISTVSSLRECSLLKLIDVEQQKWQTQIDTSHLDAHLVLLVGIGMGENWEFANSQFLIDVLRRILNHINFRLFRLPFFFAEFKKIVLTLPFIKKSS